ncbi:MAG TPA: TIGR03936 family radical SAM-associated protein [Acidimicrobiales bacterium]|nr:TIGR03936 family radical SAM-associated protein [Acidimicrobiales bacterium]
MRVRVRFTKLGRVRWTSHRDVARMWERALRRGRVPVAYTAGFTPRPQLSFGLALPTGCESLAEYLDVALTDDVDPAALAGGVSPLLPEGVDVDAAGVLDPGARSLQEDVTACAWDVEVPGVSREALEAACRRALEAEHLPVARERKGRVVTDDLRPSVRMLACREGPRGAQLQAELSTQPRGVRPSELAQALGVELGLARRTCQWIERDGSRWEPLSAGPVAAAGVHAS